MGCSFQGRRQVDLLKDASDRILSLEMDRLYLVEDVPWLDHLFRRHPRYLEKTNGGVVLGYKRVSDKGWSWRLVAVMTAQVDFSYRKAIISAHRLDNDLHGAKPDHHYRVRDALRRVIEPVITGFRWAAGHKNDKDWHCDHVYPATFETLVTRWMLGEKLLERDLVVVDRAPLPGYDLESHLLTASWLAFHNQFAVLRMVTKAENLHKGGRSA